MSFVPSVLYIISTRLRGRSFIYEYYCKGKKTLDLGCGEGEFMRHDSKRIYGLDPNKRVIERLQQDGFHATSGSATALPYADGTFEVVHCHNVIEHLDIPTAYRMLQEVARVLAHNGILVLSSEVVTKKFWHTFGHTKPYPPEAVVKLLRAESREEFDAITGLSVAGLFYVGDYHPNKLLYFLMFILGYFTPLFRREYYLILRRGE